MRAWPRFQQVMGLKMAPIVTSSLNLNYSQEMKRLMARAKLLNQYYEKDFDISFSSMLLAFLVNDDPISRWFNNYTQRAGINIERILGERKVNQQILKDIETRTILPDQLRVSYRQTTSTTIYLGMADKFRESLSRGDKTYPLQVHHLMAVYIYEPWVHKKDLIRWGFVRENWSNAFLVEMRKRYPQEFDFLRPSEFRFWQNQHRRAFLIEPDLQHNPSESNRNGDYDQGNKGVLA